MVRKDGLITLYINGINVGSNNYSFSFGSNIFTFGVYGGSNVAVTGYMRDCKVIKMAKYTSNFTPV